MTLRKALVTGGAGFIGSHLVELLLQQGCRVTVVDNLATGRLSNLSGCKNEKGLDVIEKDVAQAQDFVSAFRDCDAVFHLAGLADIVPSLQRPTDYYQTNVTGTLSVMEAARHAGVKQVVYTASSSCYGIAETVPTPETAPAKPEYPYALTKYLGEQIALHWGKVYKMRVNSLRLFNVYGLRSRTTGAYGAVFGVFLSQKLHNQPLTIVGDGTQTRDFTYVTDVARAFETLSQSDCSNEIFNVGSGHTYAVNRLAELIGGPKTHIPKRPGEPDATFADICKITRLLSWRPKVSLEEGVRTMMDRIQDWSDAPVWTPESIGQATKEWFHYLSGASPQ